MSKSNNSFKIYWLKINFKKDLISIAHQFKLGMLIKKIQLLLKSLVNSYSKNEILKK